MRDAGAAVRPGDARWQLLARDRAGAPADDEHLPVYRKLADQIGAQLPAGTQVHIGGLPQPRIWIALDAEGRQFWAVVPLGQVSAELPLQLLVALALGALFIGGCAALTASRIALPLTRLEAAVAAAGAGAPPAGLRLPASGPREVRELSRRFGEVLAARDAAESARRVMLAGLPHDLRAPLTRLRARLELVGEEKVRAGLRQDAQDVHAVMERFIAYLRGTDPAGYQFATIDLGGLVRRKCTAWAGVFPALTVRVPDGSVSMTGDAAMLERLLDALVDNAVRYGAQPIGITLDAAGPELELRVTDGGPGIAADRRADAMAPFTRLDAARSGPGTGLGLALAAAVAKMHGGRLELGTGPAGGLAACAFLAR